MNLFILKIDTIMYNWISMLDELPEIEGYYDVRFEDGTTDEKPFRIRPRHNICGFMTEKNVTHWRKCSHTQAEIEEID